MRIVLLIGLLLASTAYATEGFRVLGPEETCSDLFEKEVAAGSELVSTDVAERRYIFRSKQFGRTARFHYRCDHADRLYDATYVFPFGTFEEATGFFAELEPMLIEKHGTPDVDGRSPETVANFAATGVTQKPSEGYLLAWTSSDREILFSIVTGRRDTTEATVVFSYKYRR